MVSLGATKRSSSPIRPVPSHCPALLCPQLQKPHNLYSLVGVDGIWDVPDSPAKRLASVMANTDRLHIQKPKREEGHGTTAVTERCLREKVAVTVCVCVCVRCKQTHTKHPHEQPTQTTHTHTYIHLSLKQQSWLNQSASLGHSPGPTHTPNHSPFQAHSCASTDELANNKKGVQRSKGSRPRKAAEIEKKQGKNKHRSKERGIGQGSKSHKTDAQLCCMALCLGFTDSRGCLWPNRTPQPFLYHLGRCTGLVFFLPSKQKKEACE